MNKLYEPIFVLRAGLALIFLYFGIDKFVNPLMWIPWIPKFVLKSVALSDFTLIYLQGVILCVLGVFLLLGLFTRIAAGISAFVMLIIVIAVGFNDLGVRDSALGVMALSLALAKKHVFSLDEFLNKRKKK